MKTSKYVKILIGLEYHYIPIMEVKDKDGVLKETIVENGGLEKQLISYEELWYGCLDRSVIDRADILKGAEDSKSVNDWACEDNPLIAHFKVWGRKKSVPVYTEEVLRVIVDSPLYQDLTFS